MILDKLVLYFEYPFVRYALSVICSTAGILLAVLVGTPVGSTIVVVQIAVFIVFYAVGALKGGIGK